MLYYETKERSSKIIGVAAAVLYILLWVALLLLVKFNFEREETGEGILINFGDVESASGDYDTPDNDVNAQSPQSPSAELTPDQLLTQDFEDAPVITPLERQTSPQPVDNRTEDRRTTQDPVPAPEPSREVNRQALFPGRTEGSTSASEGTSQTGQGNQGSPEGSPAGSHDGTGTGGGGTGFNLAGRSVAGALPQPTYGANKQGRVIVEITVNSSGDVVNAVYRAVGSTTNDSELVNAALRAARQSRFNKIEGDGLQTGTITYNFKLK